MQLLIQLRSKKRAYFERRSGLSEGHMRIAQRERSMTTAVVRVLLCSLLAFVFAATKAVASPSPSPLPSPSPSPLPRPSPNQDVEQSRASRAIDPLTPNLSYSLEDESTQSIAGPSNEMSMQAQIPLGINPPVSSFLAGGHALSLVKITLPIVLAAPNGNGVPAEAGAGDLTAVWIAGFGTATSRWAGGVAFKFPTGSGTLGSGKWSIGPALGYTYQTGPWTLGLYTQSFFSYAGTGSRLPLKQTQISPAISYAFRREWSVGTSEMKYTYDYNVGSFTTLPLGIFVSKQFDRGEQRFITYFEGERNLATEGGTTWSARLGIKWILLRS